jgi:pyruvate dehydrogenase E2 component (dihydrolipoamide acetyltransferase)
MSSFMAIEITIPRLGWNMDEGVFVGWLKQDGDLVKPGDALFSLESDKAVQEVESMDAGTLHILPDGPKAGETIAVGIRIGYLLQAGEKAPVDQIVLSHWECEALAEPSNRNEIQEPRMPIDQARQEPRTPIQTDQARREPRTPIQISQARQEPRTPIQTDQARQEPRTPDEGPRSSPRARKKARELGLDWRSLAGSGRGRRVRERDILAAASAENETIPIDPTRRAIAERMIRSSKETAGVTLTTSIDATNLVNLRQQFKAVALDEGDQTSPGVISYTDIVIKLVATALERHPILNSRWDGDRITKLPKIHIGLAVDTEAGLMVPVIHDVLRLSLREVAARSQDLIHRARRRSLRFDELQGGTFTVTNLGQFGIDAFTPIINYPQCAVLGMGRIIKQPTEYEGQLAFRDRMTLSLTFDHRIVDGAPAARFLQTLAKLLENPSPWLLP